MLLRDFSLNQQKNFSTYSLVKAQLYLSEPRVLPIACTYITLMSPSWVLVAKAKQTKEKHHSYYQGGEQSSNIMPNCPNKAASSGL